MEYSIDAENLLITACSGDSCSHEGHYSSLQEANESVQLTKALEELVRKENQLQFHFAHELPGECHYLEASLITAFDEEAVFTVESSPRESSGTLLLSGKEHLLIRGRSCCTYEDFELMAHATVNEAKKFHRLDVWPTEPVVKLYREIVRDSNERTIVSSLLELEELETAGLTQAYDGETLGGTEISLRVAYGYAVAQARDSEGSRIVHEANLPHRLFTSAAERNRFTARAFGELIALGEI